MVEALPGSKIDGVCFWLNEVSPIVAVASRFDRIDNFWFVLRHELEHVDRRHGLSAVMLDTALEGDRAGVGDGVAEEARVANEAAAECCVPKRMMDALIARKAPFFDEHDIRGFAATMNVHPGLIAGQLRYRTGLDNRFGHHIVNMRSILAPNAIVDGWGNVAPID
jgi:HTH-type transcriptional regulator/antitoxin HigA